MVNALGAPRPGCRGGRAASPAPRGTRPGCRRRALPVGRRPDARRPRTTRGPSELIAMCADMGVGLVPYSPQGKGRLARPWGEQSLRSTVDKVVQAFDSPVDEPVVNAVQRIAEGRGVTMAQVALAWVLNNPGVSAPIVGATKPHHLPEAVAALDLRLTADEAHAMEEPYTRQGPSWF